MFCIGIRGNVDGDPAGAVDIADILFLVDYSFGQNAATPGCPDEANVDGNGAIDISDLIYLVDYSFNGGSAPVSCP